MDTSQNGDLANMQLTSKSNKGVRLLWIVIDVYNKYSPAIPLKDRKGEHFKMY